MTNITELKEKLINRFSRRKSKNIAEQMTEIFNDSFYVELDIEGTSYQHSQDAKTITALLEIIEEMQKCAFEIIEDGSKPIGDLGGYFIADEKYNNLLVTLTATEQKLKNLTEEK